MSYYRSALLLVQDIVLLVLTSPSLAESRPLPNALFLMPLLLAAFLLLLSMVTTLIYSLPDTLTLATSATSCVLFVYYALDLSICCLYHIIVSNPVFYSLGAAHDYEPS